MSEAEVIYRIIRDGQYLGRGCPGEGGGSGLSNCSEQEFLQL